MLSHLHGLVSSRHMCARLNDHMFEFVLHLINNVTLQQHPSLISKNLIASLCCLSTKWTFACVDCMFDDPLCGQKEMPANRCNHFILCPLVPKTKQTITTTTAAKIRACSFRHLNIFSLIFKYIREAFSRSLACSMSALA